MFVSSSVLLRAELRLFSVALVFFSAGEARERCGFVVQAPKLLVGVEKDPIQETIDRLVTKLPDGVRGRIYYFIVRGHLLCSTYKLSRQCGRLAALVY